MYQQTLGMDPSASQIYLRYSFGVCIGCRGVGVVGGVRGVGGVGGVGVCGV